MSISLTEFFEGLSRLRLLSLEQLDELRLQFAEAEPDSAAAGLSEQLVQEGVLTRFQATALLDGRSDRLVLGEYLILREIGSGGMGQVMLAKHRRMNRLVALKTLPGRVVQSKTARKQFQREIEAAAKLDHPNIATAHDAGECCGVPFLVMEYVEGEDLHTRLKRTGPFPISEAVDCVLQAARGLQHAHSHGVIHRDVKPSNLLLDRNGAIKILDMGLAALAVPQLDDAETAAPSGSAASNLPPGTAEYMAPEQALYPKESHPTADVYSLGCTLFHLLTGRVPFPGSTDVAIILAHVEQPRPSLGEYRSDATGELGDILLRMIAKEPQQRYGSMAQLIVDLAEHQTWLTDRAANGECDSEGRDTKSASMAKPLIAFGALAAVCAIAGLALQLLAAPGPFRPKSATCVLQANLLDPDRNISIRQLAECSADLVILDGSYDGSINGAYTQQEIDHIRSARDGRRVISYLSIGMVESFRPYWQHKWDADQDGRPDRRAPAFLFTRDPVWQESYRTRYWEESWHSIVFQQLDQIIEQGFDGVWLTGLQVYLNFEEEQNSLWNSETGISYREEMAHLVQAVVDRATAHNREFLIGANGGLGLTEVIGFTEMIDVFGVENCYANGERLQVDTDSQAAIDSLRRTTSTPVVVVEYCSNPRLQDACREQAAGKQLILLFTEPAMGIIGESFFSGE